MSSGPVSSYDIDITTVPLFPINARYLQASSCDLNGGFGFVYGQTCSDWPYRQVDPAQVPYGSITRRYMADMFVPWHRYNTWAFDLRAPTSCCYFLPDGTRQCGPSPNAGYAYNIDQMYANYLGPMSGRAYKAIENTGCVGDLCMDFNAVGGSWSTDQNATVADWSTTITEVLDLWVGKSKQPVTLTRLIDFTSTVSTPFPYGKYGTMSPLDFSGPWKFNNGQLGPSANPVEAVKYGTYIEDEDVDNPFTPAGIEGILAPMLAKTVTSQISNQTTMHQYSPATSACGPCMGPPADPDTQILANGYNSYGTYNYLEQQPPFYYYFGTYGSNAAARVGSLFGEKSPLYNCDDNQDCTTCCAIPYGAELPDPTSCDVLIGALPDCPTSGQNPDGTVNPASCKFRTILSDPRSGGDFRYVAVDPFNEVILQDSCQNDAYDWDFNWWLIGAGVPYYAIKAMYGDNVFGNVYSSAWCSKINFDGAWQQACCLGSFSNMTMYADGIDPMQPIDMGSVFCDPTWHPTDPEAVCAPVLVDVCSGTSSNGIPRLLDPSHGCSQWYETLLATKRDDPIAEAKWTYANAMVQRVCDSHDIEQCSCYNYSPYGTISNVLYASVSGAPVVPNTTDGVRALQLVSTASDGSIVPVNFSDYVCTQPECDYDVTMNGVITFGNKPIASITQIPSLVSSDIIDRAESCPETLCLQVIMDETIDIGVVDANYVYVADNTLICSGSAGTITTGAPNVYSSLETTLWPINTNDTSAVYQFSINIVNSAYQTSDFQWAIDVDLSSLPNKPGLQTLGTSVQNDTLLRMEQGGFSGTESVMSFELVIGLNGLIAADYQLNGLYRIPVKIMETRPQYKGIGIAFVIDLLFYAIGPNIGPNPNTPSGPIWPPQPSQPMVYYKYEEPTWTKNLKYYCAGIALFGLLLVILGDFI